MGIDVSMVWDGQTQQEMDEQNTGARGYLREAYHGGPYATRVLVPEAFGARQPVAIPVETLEQRLPLVLLCGLVRSMKVPHGPIMVSADEDPVRRLSGKLNEVKVASLQPSDSEADVPEHYLEEVDEHVDVLIAGMIATGCSTLSGQLPPGFGNFVDFVQLYREKTEAELNPMIRVSG